MYKSYFKIGWRNLLRNKGYSAINIGGLALGMSIAMLIGLWVWDEFNYNTCHKNYDRLAQVMQNQTVDGKVMTGYAIPRPLENAMRTTYGNDFEYLAMATWPADHILSVGEHSISQSGNFVQVDFPEMISLEMISGARTGLKDPASIMLSASTAIALFGTTDALNKSLRIGNQHDVKVTGVYQDIPLNSTFTNLKFLSSWELIAASEDWIRYAENKWDFNSFQLIAQLAPEADMNWISEKINQVRAIHSKDDYFKPEIFLHPMRDWHLRSHWENGVKTGGQIEMVLMFGIIGIFVLLLACINFMNLTTARAEKRAKEVGIRMAVGSARSQLVNQFLSETFLTVLFAFVFALGIVVAVMPWFNQLASKQIAIEWTNPLFWVISSAFVIITSFAAGFYPAFMLSSFKPVNVLKGVFKTDGQTSFPRKVLVVVQFTVSITLVIGTLVIYNQIQYSKNRPIGYDRDGLISFFVKSPDFIGKYEALRQTLKNTGAVVEVGTSTTPLTQIWNNSGGFNWPGKDPTLQSADFGIIEVNHEFGKTLNWQILEGRDFSHDFPSDSLAIILNEAAVRFMNIENPVGMEITNGKTKYHVIGIVKDMIMESPYLPVRHNLYFLDGHYRYVNWINMKLNPDKSAAESLATIESVFKEFAPALPFDYKFADAEYARKFSNEELIGRLAYVFAGLATVISCLGLIGLASFVAEQHTKEIAVRKILGASLLQIWSMLSRSFVVLILLSSIAAVPLAYYLMSQWLANYQYHTEISWLTVCLSVVGSLLITIATVSYQTIKAAMVNPVRSLRSE
ncbi:MAG: ABC transporter permease [Cyclobacteriaceae bacterium]|nr:ABC transporter permease [Cyclobacteriaceae bacterium]